MVSKKSHSIDDYLKISIIAGVVVIALSVAYYFVIFTPSKEAQKIELQKAQISAEAEKEQAKTISLRSCLYQADLSNTAYWNKICKTSGMDKREDDCALEMHLADVAKSYLENEQEKCYKLYQ